MGTTKYILISSFTTGPFSDQKHNLHRKVNIADKIHNMNSLIPFVIQQNSNIFVWKALVAYKLFLCDYLLYFLLWPLGLRLKLERGNGACIFLRKRWMS
ncbi:MAG: hypothetical protein ACJA0U_003090 [Salibacteraceae bacterium]